MPAHHRVMWLYIVGLGLHALCVQDIFEFLYLYIAHAVAMLVIAVYTLYKYIHCMHIIILWRIPVVVLCHVHINDY